MGLKIHLQLFSNVALFEGACSRLSDHLHIADENGLEWSNA